jgi:hypothetical protein
MLPKPAIACLVAIAFEATTALVARPWSVAKVPTPGTWDWPPTEGRNMPQTTCGYLWINPYRHKPSSGHWIYGCRQDFGPASR